MVSSSVPLVHPPLNASIEAHSSSSLDVGWFSICLKHSHARLEASNHLYASRHQQPPMMQASSSVAFLLPPTYMRSRARHGANILSHTGSRKPVSARVRPHGYESSPVGDPYELTGHFMTHCCGR
ncbi:hypothetical protein C8R45DRAFT_1084423 [Mycena sanguinolenta]|nr:hypothetical protein C8R45DRAFT_1084423 [Mycena sanguinolenta]